mgnify:CR=1 FL=1
MYQWYLLAWIGVIALFTKSVGYTRVVNSFGQKEKRYGWMTVLAVAIPLIYVAGIRKNITWGDTSAYKIMFNNLPDSLGGLSGFFTEESKDKGFTVLSVVLKSIFGNNQIIYFTLIAAVCILCVAWVYKEYSCNFFISMFLFVASADYLQWAFNGMRQFIAIAVSFACIKLILDKKDVPVIIIILL